MREIKFRAWRPETKEMVGWDDLQEHSLPYLFGYGTHELMQYTGLKDSKRTKEFPDGQEIYEGDVIKGRTYPLNPLRVEYKNAHSSFGAFAIKKGCTGVINMSVLNLSDYEVIGNIYENPELLEGEA